MARSVIRFGQAEKHCTLYKFTAFCHPLHNYLTSRQLGLTRGFVDTLETVVFKVVGCSRNFEAFKLKPVYTLFRLCAKKVTVMCQFKPLVLIRI